MRRRDFITLLSGAAVWPLAARAQQPAVPVIGWLDAVRADSASASAFHRGLSEFGYIDGRNVAIEYRYAEAQDGRLPALAAELTQRQVNAIAAFGNGAALAAKAATAIIPIVFLVGGNPTGLGLVKSLSRPGGNVTGASLLNTELDSKRLGLIAELVLDAGIVGFLVNPDNPTTASKVGLVKAAATALKRDLQVFNARTGIELDETFAGIAQRRIRALVITSDNFFSSQGERIAALTKRYAVPAIGAYRDVPANGGLMSYGGSLDDSYHQTGLYVGRILKGEKPADLPVVQSTKFELAINLKTAKALGLTVSPSLLATADEVIE
jgi:putative tryptophan/tyrosine transport system substrate-binding protein